MQTASEPSIDRLALDTDWINLASAGVAEVGAVAAGADTRRVYVGRRLSMHRRRLNLAVLTPGPEGVPVGAPEWFPDSDVPLAAGGRSSVVVAVAHPRGRLLYLGVSTDHPALHKPPPVDRRALTVWSLDSAGRPAGAPRSYDAVNEKGSVLALAVHPSLDLLYLVGHGDPRVIVYELDADGEPRRLRGSYRVGGGTGKSDIAFSPSGDLMYLGTHPDMLEVVPMTPDGTPGGAARQFSALGRWGSPASPPPYLRFHHTPRALYQRTVTPTAVRTPAAPPVSPLIVWPLDRATGYPIGEPVSHSALTGRLTAVDTSGDRIWLCGDATFPDAVTGQPRRYGTGLSVVTADRSGLPAGAAQPVGVHPTAESRLMTVAGDGRAVVLVAPVPVDRGDEVHGHQLRVTVESLTPAPAGPFSVSVMTPERRTPIVHAGMTLGVAATIGLDPLLHYESRDVVVLVTVTTGATAPERVTVRLEPLDDTGAALVEPLVDTVSGGQVGIIMAGYGFVGPDARPQRIRLLSAYATEHLRRAEQVAVAETERPRLLTVSSSHLLGKQGHPEQLRTEARTLALLGMNTVNAYDWPGLDPATIDAELDAAGLTRRAVARYQPLQGHPTGTAAPHDRPQSFFDFYLRRYPRDVADWAQAQATGVGAANGATPDDVVDFKLSDEPAWYFPFVNDLVVGNYLTDFHEFLRAHVTLADLGAPDWDSVRPRTNAAGASLQVRRLYYWTTRFFAEAAARGHRMVTDELTKAFNPDTSIDVNWNNWINAWYAPAPNQRVGKNPHIGPESGMGSFDWFLSARLGAHNLWSASWYPDDTATLWSARINALGSAAALGTRPFGGYIVGNILTGHPAGASYKALSLVGRGGKTVDFYAFGPALLVGDGWSDNPLAYPSIADATRVLARAEHLIHPGRPTRGSIAILTTGTSHLWNAGPGLTLYMWETIRLSIALMHAGYTVDLIDEQAIRDELDPEQPGNWPYSTLYITGPNIETQALQRITTWVKDGGGVLAAGPEAGVADEFNTASPLLEQVLGLGPRTAERTNDLDPHYYDHTLHPPTDPQFGPAQWAIRGPVTPLQPATAGTEVVATLNSGQPAITRHRFGKGTAITYAFHPGLQYIDTLEHPLDHRGPRDLRTMVRGWEDSRRQLATAPAVLAHAAKPVQLNHDLVEVCRLDSEHGTALILLNWSDQPIDDLQIVICEQRRWRNIHTARHAPVDVTRTGNHLTVQMPLQHTDVLLLEYDAPHRR